MKYKVWDRVRITSEKIWGIRNHDGEMDKWLGNILTICEVDNCVYRMKEDSAECGWYWRRRSPEMIECKIAEKEEKEAPKNRKNKYKKLKNKYKKLKASREFEQDVLEASHKEFRVERLHRRYLTWLLEEVEVLSKDKLVLAVIENGKKRHELDKEIHAKVIFSKKQYKQCKK